MHAVIAVCVLGKEYLSRSVKNSVSIGRSLEIISFRITDSPAVIINVIANGTIYSFFFSFHINNNGIKTRITVIRIEFVIIEKR